MPNYFETESKDHDLKFLKHRGIYIFSTNRNAVEVFRNFYNKTKGTKYERLAASIQAMPSTDEANQTEFFAISIYNFRVYCGMLGRAWIRIERDGQNFPLFSKEEGIRIGSGKLNHGDKLIVTFSTGSLVLKYKNTSAVNYLIMYFVNLVIAFLKIVYSLFRHRRLPVFGFVVIVCLLISLFVGIQKRKDMEIQEKKQKFEEHINNEISKVKALYVTDTESSWNLYQDIRLQSVNEPNLTSKLDSISRELFRIENVKAKRYFDFGLIDQNFEVDEFGGASGLMVFASRKAGKIVTLESIDKHTEIYPIEGTGKINVVTSYLEEIYYQKDNSIYNIENKIVLGEINQDVLIKAYTGSMYILDKNKHSILRASPVEGRFATAQDWFSKSVSTPDEIAGWSIDGAIWVINPGGVIFRYSGGAIASYFTLTNAFFEKIDVTGFYTDETLANLYVLYDGGSAIGEYGKDGKFLKEYRLDNDIKFDEICVSSNAAQIIGISSKELYSIELK